jgi:hypothetical protein
MSEIRLDAAGRPRRGSNPGPLRRATRRSRVSNVSSIADSDSVTKDELVAHVRAESEPDAVVTGTRGVGKTFVALRARGVQALRDALSHSDRPEGQALWEALADIVADHDALMLLLPPSTDEEYERFERLVQYLTPDDIPQPVELLQARRSAQMRRDMLASFGYYSAEELADRHGSKAANRYATATRWSREGKVFGVPLGARTVFPAFQFNRDGQPYPIVRHVLATLPRDDMSPWAVGLWWYASNPDLPGHARPAELISTPDEPRLLDAARELTEPQPF